MERWNGEPRLQPVKDFATGVQTKVRCTELVGVIAGRGL